MSQNDSCFHGGREWGSRRRERRRMIHDQAPYLISDYAIFGVASSAQEGEQRRVGRVEVIDQISDMAQQ